MESQEAKANFAEILNNINRKYDIILANWSDNKNFEVRLRTEIPRDNEDFNGLCDEWVDLFSTVTNTIWVKKISNTGPKIRFRKQYQCWTQGSKVVKKELLFDARRCKGTLDMKVLNDTPLTRRKNKHIRMGLNAVVKINFNHLHPVNVEQPFAFFVHTCAPQPEPLLTPIIPPPVAPIVQTSSSATSVTTIPVVTMNDHKQDELLVQHHQHQHLQQQQDHQQQQHIMQIAAPQLELSADNLLMCFDPTQSLHQLGCVTQLHSTQNIQHHFLH